MDRRTLRTGLTALGLCLALAACGGGTSPPPQAAQQQQQVATHTPQAPRVGTYKVGNPYQINGAWYYPKVDYAYKETGIASWYGPKFHGRDTANGETFDQNALTAAHRTLPMPSMVQVTNLENGRQLKLRINDRGPYARGRIIDVSKRAAELLGFKDQGTARVRVAIVEGDSRRLAAAAQGQGGTPPRAAPTTAVASAPLDGGDGGAAGSSRRETRRNGAVPWPDGQVTYVQVDGNPEIFIQAGAFVDYANARRLSGDLARLAPTQIKAATVNDRRFFRVRLGPVATVAAADRLLARLDRQGHREAHVIVD